jgi:acyl-CoA synthetase (AMP-forming)/AMP-acid ligase II
MRGLMMATPLLISSIITHAARHHGAAEIVSRTVEGPYHHYTYRDAERRIKQLANALVALGLAPGDRVATLAWNGYRHLELFHAISSLGAVCHTINPRLFKSQIEYIVNHAADVLLFTDLCFAPLVAELRPTLGPLRQIVVLTDRQHMPVSDLPDALCYEELLAEQSDRFSWPVFDEETASALCYTSGTTGHPKGVLYSHRSTLLHAFAVLITPGLQFGPGDVMLPVVPLFHANGWGIPYLAPMVGAKLVLPGPKLDGASLYELLERERVTTTWGVPTVWFGLLQYLRDSGQRLTTLKSLVSGGSAVPPALVRAFEETYRVEVVHGWGMTEMSPVGACSGWVPPALAAEERWRAKQKQGKPIFGVEMKIVDADDHELPQDDVSFGELLVRGPNVARGYFADDAATRDAFSEDGWLRTGDVATIDPEGGVQILDRMKDMIKSGGEWISSIELENAALNHRDVAEAAVIGVRHPVWSERPLLLVVPRPGAQLVGQEILAFLAGRIAKWWLPDDVVVLDQLPHTATGKLWKADLRERFREHLVDRVKDGTGRQP